MTNSNTYLMALYSIGSNLYLKETASINALAVFRDDYSDTRHTLVEAVPPISRPSATTHQGSHWVAWRENNTIYARAIWWRPSRTRTIYEGGANTPTAPAIINYDGQLVVVWGVDNSLYLSSSEFGIVWTAPLGKTFAGAIINSPALADHNGKVYVGIVLGPTLYTVRIKEDLTWGPNFQ